MKRIPVLELDGVERQFVSSKDVLFPICSQLCNYFKDYKVNNVTVRKACLYFFFAVVNFVYNNPDKYLVFEGENIESYIYKPDGLTRFMTVACRKQTWFDDPHLRTIWNPSTFLKKYNVNKDELKEFRQILTDFIDNLTFDAMEQESQATEVLKEIKDLKDNKDTQRKGRSN